MLFQIPDKKGKQLNPFYLLLFVVLHLFVHSGLLWAAVPDAYEPDNAFDEAQLLVADPHYPSQQHSFHQLFDEDWYKFYCYQGPQGPYYRISATPDSVSSDPVIEMYSIEGVKLPARADENGPGEQELLNFQCLEEGYYYIKITNKTPYFDTDVSYTFSMNTWFDIIFFPNGYIQGKVTSGGVGLGGVLLSTGGGVGVSHSDGTYLLGHRVGNIQLSAGKDGYYSRVFSLTVAGDQVTRFDFELDKIPTPGNPPEISGTPSTVVGLNQLYSFIPTATDPDGDSILFSISNKPAWASFNPDTGMLVGRPAKPDAGTYGPIVITASDSLGQSASLQPFFIKVQRIVLPGILMLLNEEVQP